MDAQSKKVCVVCTGYVIGLDLLWFIFKTILNVMFCLFQVAKLPVSHDNCIIAMSYRSSM